MPPRGKAPTSSGNQASLQGKQILLTEVVATSAKVMTGRAYIESLNNFLVNLDLNNLEWLPKFKGSTSFHVFPIRSPVPESPRRELEFWMTGTIKTSNLEETRPQEWILDLTVEDSINDTFNSLIGRGTYPLSSARNPNFFGCIWLKSKLKKHQEYIILSQLTVFPQLFDAINLSDITTLTKDGGKFSVENFDVGTLVTVECSVMAYKFTT